MNERYIMLICAGGVFVLLFLVYLVCAIKHKSCENRKIKALKDSYQTGNLKRMEYDYASYDEGTEKKLNNDEIGQVTIDDIIAGNNASSDKTTTKSDEEIFAKIDSEGVEEIKGNFKP